MGQKNGAQKNKNNLIFRWDNVPDHIYFDIQKRMEFHGLKTFREYIRFIINKDIEKWKEEIYGKTADD